MGRKCTIKGCSSKTTGPQPSIQGVITYHSFPFDSKIRDAWITNCQLESQKNITKSVLVCSRHFRSSDFKMLNHEKKSGYYSPEGYTPKFLLKPGTVPSIFPWNRGKNSLTDEDFVVEKPPTPTETTETVKATIAQIMAETAELNKAAGIIEPSKSKRSSTDSIKLMRNSFDATVAASTVGIIEEYSNFAVGTKVEAQDFSGVWHSAKVIEVDNDEREVFIKYEKSGRNSKAAAMSDEWIPMNSSRLRLKVMGNGRPIPVFVEDEKCLAKWTGSRRFPATVTRVVGNDTYEVLFDDGYRKTVKGQHMSKVKGGTDVASISPTLEASLQEVAKREESQEWTLISKSSLNMDELNLPPIPEDGEWCCYWVNDQPIGDEGFLTVGDNKKPTVIVQDWRLPKGWIKHMYQRSNVLGKWDVILVSPHKKRFRSKSDLKAFLLDLGEAYNPDIYDFSIHRRRSKDIGAYVYTNDYQKPPVPKPPHAAYFLEQSTPSKSEIAEQLEATPFKESQPPMSAMPPAELMTPSYEMENLDDPPILEEGYVYVGALKVQLIDNLFKCPDENCSKTFRKEIHFQIHVKHYHPNLIDKLGSCPNMQELAYKRTFATPQSLDHPAKNQIPNQQFFAKMHQQDQQARSHRKSLVNTPVTSTCVTPVHSVAASPIHEIVGATHLDSPDMAMSPMHAEHATGDIDDSILDGQNNASPTSVICQLPLSAQASNKGRKSQRQRTTRKFVQAESSKVFEDSFGVSDLEETRHSFNLTPDIQKHSPGPSAKRQKLHYNTSISNTGDSLFDSNQSQITSSSVLEAPSATGSSLAGSVIACDSPKYISENGEIIKIVRMRQEEIINCICSYGEEDGLMIQCELCLCWQHGGCHGIEKESQVPDKYICYICRNPQRGRQSLKYIHDQEWMYDGKLPSANYHSPNPNRAERYDLLKKSHTLTGNLLELKNFLRSLQVKMNIAENKDHPKLYLWSKEWDDVKARESSKEIQNKEGNDPTPEAPIDPAECQKLLLKHLRVQKAKLMERFNQIETQVSELEASDRLPEAKTDLNTTKETHRIIIKDLETVEKLASINLIANAAAQQYQTVI